MTVAQLFARIGLKADTDSAQKFSTSVKGIVSQLKGAAIGAGVFGQEAKAAMAKAAQAAKSAQNTPEVKRKTGDLVSDLGTGKVDELNEALGETKKAMDDVSASAKKTSSSVKGSLGEAKAAASKPIEVKADPLKVKEFEKSVKSFIGQLKVGATVAAGFSGAVIMAMKGAQAASEGLGFDPGTEKVDELNEALGETKKAMDDVSASAKKTSSSVKGSLGEAKAAASKPIEVKADPLKVKEFEKSVKSFIGQLKVGATVAAGFSGAVIMAMKGALDSAAAFRQFQAETGASSEELQKWQAIASGTNVSTQAIADSVKELAQNREKIKLGGGNMSGFAFLGINPMDDPFKILDQLRTKTQGLPQAMKANLLAQMGVSSQFLQILNLTNAEFDRMRSNAFVIPPSALNSLNQTQGNLNTLGNAVKWIQALMAERLAPIIDRVVKSVTEWIKVNKDGLITGILNGTRLIVKFFEAVYNVVSWIGKFIAATIGGKNALNVFLVALAYFNRALLMSPIGLLVGGILLLVAVLDDLHAAFGVDGDKRESFFGSIFKKFPEVKKSFEDTFAFLKDFGNVIKGLFGGDQKAFDAVIKKWGVFGDAIKAVRDYVQWLIENFGKIFGSAGKDLETLDQLLKGNNKPAQDALKEWFDNNFGRGLYGILGPQLSDMFGVKPEVRGAAAGAGAVAGSGSPVSVEVKNTSTGPISSQVEVKRGTSEAKSIQTNRGRGY